MSRLWLVEGIYLRKKLAVNLINAAIVNFGRVDILINNEESQNQKLLVDMTFEEWKRLMSVNLNGVFLTCKYAVPHMIQQRFGRIINIASQVGQKGSVEHCHYRCC